MARTSGLKSTPESTERCGPPHDSSPEDRPSRGLLPGRLIAPPARPRRDNQRAVPPQQLVLEEFQAGELPPNRTFGRRPPWLLVAARPVTEPRHAHCHEIDLGRRVSRRCPSLQSRRFRVRIAADMGDVSFDLPQLRATLSARMPPSDKTNRTSRRRKPRVTSDSRGTILAGAMLNERLVGHPVACSR